MRAMKTLRGQALVEFALALPLLILLLVGIFDFGRAIYAYNTLNNAAREAGRLAIVDQTEADIQAVGVQRAASLGIQPADVTVDYRAPDDPTTANSCTGTLGEPDTVGCLAVVHIQYQYNAATPIIGNLVGTLTLTGETSFPIEFNCVDDAGSGLDCPIGANP